MSAEDNKQIRSIDHYINKGIAERGRKQELLKLWLQRHCIGSKI